MSMTAQDLAQQVLLANGDPTALANAQVAQSAPPPAMAPPPGPPPSAASAQLINYGIGAPLPGSGDQAAASAVPLPNPLPANAGNLPVQGLAPTQEPPKATMPPDVATGALSPAPATPVKPSFDFDKLLKDAKGGSGGGGGDSSDLDNITRVGTNEQIEGAERLAKVEGQKGAAEAALRGQETQNLQQQAAYQQQRAQEMKSYADAHFAKLQALGEDITNSKIDPNHYINSMSTGSRILAGIAMAFGGGGAAVAHQQNAAAEVINDGIKRDIEAQAANIQNKKAGFEAQSNLVHQYMQAGASIDEAKLAASATLSKIVQNKIQASAATFASPEAQAGAQAAIGKLNVQPAKDQSELQSQTMSRMAAASTIADNREGLFEKKVGFGLQLHALKDQANNPNPNTFSDAQVQALPDKERELAVQVKPGQWMKATSADGAKNVSAVSEGVKQMKSSIETIRRLRQMHPNGELVGADKNAAKVAAADLLQGMGKLEGVTRLSDADLQLRKEIIPDDPLSIMNPQVMSRLDAASNSADSHLENALSTYTVGYRAPPSGYDRVTPRT